MSSPGDDVKRPPLPLSFFEQDTVSLARHLLGKGLIVKASKSLCLVQIVEVEAYLGGADPASHAFRGRTERNKSMFEVGGTCYVYQIYGMHFCMNVGAGAKGVGEAVLLRAGLPLLGKSAMMANRGGKPGAEIPERKLLNGPAKLCQALGVDRRFDGMRFDRKDFKIIDLDNAPSVRDIGCSPRIGISKALEMELRFFIKGSPWLSRREAD